MSRVGEKRDVYKRQALPRCQNRNAGRVAHNELAADHTLGLAQGQALFGGVKRLLRAGGNLGVDVFLTQEACAISVIAAHDLGQCADKTLDLCLSLIHI